jgi:glucose uptake protein
VLAAGVGAIVIAIVLDALAYRNQSETGTRGSVKGILVSIAAGLLMGWFYSFVAASMATITTDAGQVALLPAGKLTSYTALVLFGAGLLASSFLWNSLLMLFPLSGPRVPFGNYFTKGNFRLHLVGIAGGVIWSIGMCFNVIASTKAGPALAYGLGQGATLIGAFWGVFIWREFKNATVGTNAYLTAMFAFYVVGLGILIVSKT